MRKVDLRKLKRFVLSNQTKLNKIGLILLGIVTVVSTGTVYSDLQNIRNSVNQLIIDAERSNNSSVAAVKLIHGSISQTVFDLITIVILTSFLAAIFIWNLARHIQLSQLLVSRHRDGVCITDKHLNIQHVNQAFCQLTHLSENQLYGHTLYDCFPKIFPTKESRIIEAFNREFVNQETDGTETNTEMAFAFVAQTKRSTKFGVLTIRDTTKLKQSEATFRNLAFTDHLTHLPNRAHLMGQMKTLIQNYSTSGNRFALFFLDLDGFKDINDSLGHKAGDEFLIRMAKRLSTSRRDNDFVARLGGDEFCILIEDFNDLDMLDAISKRLLDRIAEPLTLDGRSITPQTSIGYAIYPDHAQNRDGLLQAADMAMYKAKNAGKHRAVLFDPNITHMVRDRLDLEHDLRIAIDEQQFILFYQPQVSLQTGQMTGVEALIRWIHPEKGMVFPDQFIDTLERLGLMEVIGDWVILEACKQQKRWHDAGIDLDVAVNVSGSHFQSGNLINSTKNALATAGIPASRLELEITENVMQVADATIENFIALRKLGVTIAIDDFGTGYSSLGSLRTLPVDHLKVDRMFLHDVLVDEKQAVIISTIIGMAQALGLKVIVEGVETMDHILLLQSLGCNLVQGYYFSKPVASSDISALYHSGFHSNNISSPTKITQITKS